MQNPGPPYNIFVARILTGALLTINVINGIIFVGASHALIDSYGKPLGYDFITFWSAGYLTLAGQAEAAFDLARISAVQALAVPNLEVVYAWHYPPTFQLVAAPLALFPYIPSYLGFTAATLAAFLASITRLSNQRETLLWLIAFPGTIICIMHGQNSMLTGALFAGAILCLERRPILAGVLIGLLAIKPQLGLLIPIALIAAGQWRTIGAAAVTTITFAAISTAILGLDLWVVFLENASFVRHLMESESLQWAKMPSLFIALRMLSVSEGVAYAAHGIGALAVVVLTAVVWRRCGPSRLAGAVLVSGTLLILPYLFDYELVLLAIPLVILLSDMADRSAALWEKALLPMVYIIPQFVVPVGESIGLQIGFPAIAATFLLCVYRATVFKTAVDAEVTSEFDRPVGGTEQDTRE